MQPARSSGDSTADHRASSNSGCCVSSPEPARLRSVAQHRAGRVDQERAERVVTGLERLACQRHAARAGGPGPARRSPRSQPATRTCSSSGLVCRACNRCGSSSGPPATSGAGRCTRSSAATTWSSSASTPTARTRSAGTPPSCAAGRSRPASLATERRRGAAGAGAGRLLLQPALAEHRRAGRAARGRRQRLHQRRLDHRRQAERRRPRPASSTPARQGRSTIFGSGAHPGMTNLVAMALSGSCERVDSVVITESVDCSTYESAGTQIAMGFSQPPDTPGLADSVRRESEVFAESAAMMANAMGVVLDEADLRRHLHRGHRRQRPGLHDDPKRDGRRRAGLPPRLGAARRTSSASASTG